MDTHEPSRCGGKTTAVPSAEQDPAETISRLMAEARARHEQDPERALRLAEEALALAERGAEHRLAACALEVGVCHRWLTHHDKALAHLDRALRLSRQRPDPVIESRCLGEIALLRAYQADYPALIETALLALSLARAMEDEDRIGKLLQYVGVGYFELGDYAAALPYYLDALDEAERAGREAELSFALHNLAALYQIMGDGETGRFFAEKSLLVARRSGTAINEAGALCQISEHLSRQGEYRQALEVSREALAVACRIRQTQPSAEMNVRQVQGKARLGLGQWPEAIASFEDALHIARSSQDRRHESILLQELASAYRHEGRFADAKAALKLALAAAEETQAKQRVYTAHRDLGKLCQEEGDLAGALAHAERYHAVEREVLTAEADNRTKALAVRMQVETAKQEALAHRQDADLHRLRNVDLGAANGALEQANRRLQDQAEELRAQAEELAKTHAAVAESEARLSRNERRLRLALESGRLGSYELDVATGRYLEVSDTYKAQLGLPPTAEVTLETLAALIHPEDRVRIRNMALKANRELHVFEAEHRVIWNDGSVHWIRTHGQPIFEETTRTTRLIGIHEDITERKALEAVREQFAAREHTIAAQLQAALQPTLPEHIPGLAVGKFIRPGLAESEVGGDFYDIFPLEGDLYAVVLGDVSGKGLAAAQQLATIRYSLRTLLYLFRRPAEAVTRLNAILTTHDLIVGFLTAFVGVYDAATGGITYASCAHEPALVRRVNGAVEAWGTTGPPLGVAERADYGESAFTLSSGDSLLLYTDGISEAGTSRRAMLGLQGLTSLWQGSPTDESAQAEVEALLAQISAFSDGVFRDDVTLLLARRL